MSPLLILGIIVVALVIVLVVRTLNFPIRNEEVEPLSLPEVDGESVAQRIGLAVQYRTISNRDPSLVDSQPFEGLHELLRTLYPQLHEQLTCEVINHHALLYTWPGTNSDLDAVCFAAHQDVVPADESEDSGWLHPPFAGELADGYVWGRGTLDCKGTLIGIMEAVNNLLKSGYQPERTIYLAFGDDEEVSGLHGARAIVETLQARGIQLAFMLDEGGAVTRGTLYGIDRPVGQVGISEKGYLSLRLKAKVTGGHSSVPPARTAIGSLGLAIAALEANPFPQRLDVIQFMMSFVGEALPFFERMRYANLWLFGGGLKRKLAANPVTNALTRTTTAPTIFHAGNAENVLPAEAEALVNFRILPGDTVTDVYQSVSDMVGDEVLEALPAQGETIPSEYAWDPTPVADVDSPEFERLAELIRASFPGALVAPYLMTGATDSRHYAPICQNIFRFSPFFLSTEETSLMHSANERLSFINAGRMVAFYQELIRQESSLAAEPEIDLEAEHLELEEEPKPRRVSRRTRQRQPEREEEPSVEESVELQPLPEDDEPLDVKPLKKSKGN
jgi:carboxypeptidase PM20D1